LLFATTARTAAKAVQHQVLLPRGHHEGVTGIVVVALVWSLIVVAVCVVVFDHGAAGRYSSLSCSLECGNGGCSFWLLYGDSDGTDSVGGSGRYSTRVAFSAAFLLSRLLSRLISRLLSFQH
jgi:hypothetical protein